MVGDLTLGLFGAAAGEPINQPSPVGDQVGKGAHAGALDLLQKNFGERLNDDLQYRVVRRL